MLHGICILLEIKLTTTTTTFLALFDIWAESRIIQPRTVFLQIS